MRPARHALLLALLLLLAPLQAGAFIDVDGTRYGEAADFLRQRGMLRGYADGSVRPRGAINRVEALALILESHSALRERLRWYEEHLPRMSLFLDVPQTIWYAPVIETAFEAGLITGYPDRTFRPGSKVTVEEAATLLMRAYDRPAAAAGAGQEWFRPAVESAIAKHLLAAEEPLYLGEPLSRGQLMDMVYRMVVVHEGRLAAFRDGSGSATPRSALTFRPLSVVSSSPLPPSRLPSPPTTPPTNTAFSISIPALGIENLRVSRPADSSSQKGLLAPLRHGVGHLFGYPGAGSKIMIYGHSSGYAWDVSPYTKIFRQVNRLRTGDRVYVTYNGKVHTYEVTHQQTIAPTDVQPFTGLGEDLILYTCWPPDSIKTRLIVHAKPVEAVALR